LDSGALIGKRLGNFDVISLVAEGGMGAVYLAKNHLIQMTAAIKVIKPEIVHQSGVVQRFKAEANIENRLNHPNIVTVYDFGELDDGGFYYAMEALKGQTLMDVIKQSAPMAPEQVTPILKQTCGALQAAHDHGVVHRDLKPENVMILEGPESCVKLLDFGIAKLLPSSQVLTHGSIEETAAGAIFGSPHVAAPEQARGDVDLITHKSDLYSLGVILYWMLSGEPPFVAATAGELFEKHANSIPVPLGVKCPHLPRPLTDLVCSCLAKQPEERPTSAEEVSRRFDSALVSTPLTVVASEQSRLKEVILRTAQSCGDFFRKRAVLWAVAFAGLAVALWTLVAVVGQKSSPLDTAQNKASRRKVADIDWILLPAGSYVMGAESGHTSERPARKVKLQAFKLSKSEVTTGQYMSCVEKKKCPPPEWARIDSEHYYKADPQAKYSKFMGDEQPVVGVSWSDARAFCKWAGGRLPSESEWEYAARGGGTVIPYPWGKSGRSCERVVMDDNGNGCGKQKTWNVCSKRQGNTEHGLCDMLGNVWEWVEDCWHDNYEGAPKGARAWTRKGDCKYRVVRGGSWYFDPGNLETTKRGKFLKSKRDFHIGFRCRKDPL